MVVEERVRAGYRERMMAEARALRCSACHDRNSSSGLGRSVIAAPEMTETADPRIWRRLCWIFEQAHGRSTAFAPNVLSLQRYDIRYASLDWFSALCCAKCVPTFQSEIRCCRDIQ